MQDQPLSIRRKHGRFFITENSALDLVRLCGPMAFCLYSALLRYTTGYHECKPSINHLAATLGIARTSIWRHMKRLEAVGAVHIEERPGYSHLYTVIDPSDLPGGAFHEPSRQPADGTFRDVSEPAEITASDSSEIVAEESDSRVNSGDDVAELQQVGISELQQGVFQICNTPPIAKMQYPSSIKISSYKDTQIKTALTRESVCADASCMSSPTAATDARFVEFWSSYPRKVGKQAALRIWRKLNPDDELLEQMKRAIRWQSATEQWRKQGGRFIPHPATWLNQGRWQDEPTATPKFSENVERIAERLRVLGLCKE